MIYFLDIHFDLIKNDAQPILQPSGTAWTPLYYVHTF